MCVRLCVFVHPRVRARARVCVSYRMTQTRCEGVCARAYCWNTVCGHVRICMSACACVCMRVGACVLKCV